MNPKQAAGEAAAALVEDGMLVGLGSGSTAACFIDALGKRVAEGLRITAVASSVASAEQAVALGIGVVDRIERAIDLTVDGADEIDPKLDLVKGLGGALLREKVVAAASARMVVVGTEDKLVDRLGRGPLPVEVLPLLHETTAWRLDALGLKPVLRRDVGGGSFVSDNGNVILDCTVPRRRSAARLAPVLESIPGVLGHGLFLGMASSALIASPAGDVRELTRPT